jgi:hypothetical protein
MKKIENILFIPALILLFLGISKNNTGATDIHFNDTFFVLENRTMAGWFLAWLIFVIILFKIIRRRHNYINKRVAAPYIILTVVFYLFFFLGNFMQGGGRGMSDAQLQRWTFYNQLKMVTAAAFLLVQLIFLIYFTWQMIRPRRLVGA